MSQLHDREVDEYLRKCVSVEPLAINEEYIQVSADIAYWGEQYADALRAHLIAKLDAETTEARLYLTLRETLLGAAVSAAAPVDDDKDKSKKRPAAPKAPTVEVIEASVASHPEYLAAKQTAIEAEVRKDRLKNLLSAVHAKKDMLVSLGAHVRAEMDADPMIRKQHALSRDISRQR